LALLEGRLPEGYKMMDRKAYDPNDHPIPFQGMVIHSVLMFAPLGIADNKDLMSKIKENLQIATRDYKINPLVIVTRAEEEGEEGKRVVLQKISKELNYPTANIWMVENYTNQREKDFVIDRRTLSILNDCIRKGTQFIRVTKDEPPAYSKEPVQPKITEPVQPKITEPVPTPVTPEKKDIYGLEEAAGFLDCRIEDVLEALKTKQLQGRQIGLAWRISHANLEKYLNGD